MLGSYLKVLKVPSAQDGIVLTETQFVALEKAKSNGEAAGEIKTHYPRYLGS